MHLSIVAVVYLRHICLNGVLRIIDRHRFYRLFILRLYRADVKPNLFFINIFEFCILIFGLQYE